MQVTAAILALFFGSSAAFLPPAIVQQRSSVIVGAETLSKKSVLKTIKRATKENFGSTVYDNAEVEAFIKGTGATMYPKLKKVVEKRAFDLGVAKKDGFAKKPWSGPELWTKGEAMKAIKAAMEKRDSAAIEEAISAANALSEVVEGEEKAKMSVPFAKPAEGDAKPQASAVLVQEAEALMATLAEEESAAAAAAEAAAAPAEEEPPVEEAPAEEPASE